MLRKLSILIILAMLVFVGVVTANADQATLKQDTDWFAPLIKADKDKIDDEYLVDLYLESHLPKHIKHLQQCLEPDEASRNLLHKLREREQEYEEERSSQYWVDDADMYKATHLTEGSLDCIRRDPGVGEVGENYWIESWDPIVDGESTRMSTEELEAIVAAVKSEAMLETDSA